MYESWSYDKQTIVIPLYDHITSCHMTIPYSIMYIYKFMSHNTLIRKPV